MQRYYAFVLLGTMWKIEKKNWSTRRLMTVVYYYSLMKFTTRFSSHGVGRW